MATGFSAINEAAERGDARSAEVRAGAAAALLPINMSAGAFRSKKSATFRAAGPSCFLGECHLRRCCFQSVASCHVQLSALLQAAETVEAQEARLVASYERSLQLTQSGAHEGQQARAFAHGHLACASLKKHDSWRSGPHNFVRNQNPEGRRSLACPLYTQAELRALLADPLLAAVRPRSLLRRGTLAPAQPPSLPAQLRFLALKNLAASCAGEGSSENSRREALQLYGQAAALDAGDIVLWSRMGRLVMNCFHKLIRLYQCLPRILLSCI